MEMTESFDVGVDVAVPPLEDVTSETDSDTDDDIPVDFVHPLRKDVAVRGLWRENNLVRGGWRTYEVDRYVVVGVRIGFQCDVFQRRDPFVVRVQLMGRRIRRIIAVRRLIGRGRGRDEAAVGAVKRLSSVHHGDEMTSMERSLGLVEVASSSVSSVVQKSRGQWRLVLVPRALELRVGVDEEVLALDPFAELGSEMLCSECRDLASTRKAADVDGLKVVDDVSAQRRRLGSARTESVEEPQKVFNGDPRIPREMKSHENPIAAAVGDDSSPTWESGRP